MSKHQARPSRHRKTWRNVLTRRTISFTMPGAVLMFAGLVVCS